MAGWLFCWLPCPWRSVLDRHVLSLVSRHRRAVLGQRLGSPADTHRVHAAAVVHVARAGTAVGCRRSSPCHRHRPCGVHARIDWLHDRPYLRDVARIPCLSGGECRVGVIVGRAVIRDLYDGPQAQKLLSLVTMIFGFAPAVAPVIGGWIHVTLGCAACLVLWRPSVRLSRSRAI